MWAPSGQVDGALAARALALLADGRAEPEDVIVGLVEDLDGAAGLTVIALDDLHLMTTGQAATDAFASLIDNLPPRVVVAATSRTDPVAAVSSCGAANWSAPAMSSDLTTLRPRRFPDLPAPDLQAAQIQARRPNRGVGGRT